MFTKCIELNSELFYARGFKWVTTLLGTRRDTVPPAGGARFSCAARAGPELPARCRPRAVCGAWRRRGEIVRIITIKIITLDCLTPTPRAVFKCLAQPARECALLDLEQPQRLVLLGEAPAQPGRQLEKLQLALHRCDTIRRARRLLLLLDAPVHAAPIGTLQLRAEPAG
jgi:hypothetical protein